MYRPGGLGLHHHHYCLTLCKNEPKTLQSIQTPALVLVAASISLFLAALSEIRRARGGDWGKEGGQVTF